MTPTGLSQGGAGRRLRCPPSNVTALSKENKEALTTGMEEGFKKITAAAITERIGGTDPDMTE
jgi:hypothetical protein